MSVAKNQRGFTLIEIVLTLAITAMLILGVIASQGGLRKEAAFNTAIDEVHNKIIKVQNEAFSGVKGGTAGSGNTTEAVFGKLVEFNEADTGKMRVYTLIADAEAPNEMLQACDEEVITLPSQLTFGGTAKGVLAKQAIIFTRESGSVFVSPAGYTFTPTASCNAPVYATDTINNGAAGPGPSQCSDGFDNDGDGKIDFPQDNGCFSAADTGELLEQCRDGLDNDTDGKIDMTVGNPDLGCTGPNDDDEVNPPQCSDTWDNDGDTRKDFPTDPGCANALDNDERNSFPVTISPTSGDFRAWHLARTGGGPYRTQTFTVTNPAGSPAPIRLKAPTITGTHASSFFPAGGTCPVSPATLAPNTSCTVVVRFSPPSGGSHNHLSNAGPRFATLVVGNNDFVSPDATASLVGWTVSDRMAPGDSYHTTGDDGVNAARALRSYQSGCYNDAFNCSSSILVLFQNGNLVYYPDSQTGNAAWMTGEGPGRFIDMNEDNGVFGLFTNDGPGVWGTAASNNGVWVQMFPGSFWLMNPSWESGGSGYARIFP